MTRAEVVLKALDALAERGDASARDVMRQARRDGWDMNTATARATLKHLSALGQVKTVMYGNRYFFRRAA